MHITNVRQLGWSLVEILIPLAVTGVLLGNAVPALKSFKDRRQLEGAAAQLETDLQLARMTAVARQQVLRVDFVGMSDGGTCYVLHDGAQDDCSCDGDRPQCESGTTPLRSVMLPASGPLSLSANVRGIGFEPIQGTVTPTATVRLRADVGSLRLVINVMGRVRGCTPDGAVPGWPSC